jgi:peroxiredoxin Q/BCP
MKLLRGMTAPNFQAVDHYGKRFDLYEAVAGRSYVLYFYPKDFTPTCTVEACTFRDEFTTFSGADIPIIGISPDSVETHQRFVAEFQIPFTLIADTDKKVGELYGAIMPIIRMFHRVTYFIDKNHTIIDVVQNMFGADIHIKTMMANLASVK